MDDGGHGYSPATHCFQHKPIHSHAHNCFASKINNESIMCSITSVAFEEENTHYVLINVKRVKRDCVSVMEVILMFYWFLRHVHKYSYIITPPAAARLASANTVLQFCMWHHCCSTAHAAQFRSLSCSQGQKKLCRIGGELKNAFLAPTCYNLALWGFKKKNPPTCFFMR